MTKQNNNAGITLLELITVITILGILAGGVIVALGLRKGASASSCADMLDSKLEQAKTETMSRETESYFVLYRKVDGYYVACAKKRDPFRIDAAEEQKVGDQNMTITITTQGGQVEEVGSQGIVMRFDRASGAFLHYGVLEHEKVMEQGCDPKQITITAKGKTSSVILVPQTGRHYIE